MKAIYHEIKIDLMYNKSLYNYYCCYLMFSRSVPHYSFIAYNSHSRLINYNRARNRPKTITR